MNVYTINAVGDRACWGHFDYGFVVVAVSPERGLKAFQTHLQEWVLGAELGLSHTFGLSLTEADLEFVCKAAEGTAPVVTLAGGLTDFG